MGNPIANQSKYNYIKFLTFGDKRCLFEKKTTGNFVNHFFIDRVGNFSSTVVV